MGYCQLLKLVSAAYLVWTRKIYQLYGFINYLPPGKYWFLKLVNWIYLQKKKYKSNKYSTQDLNFELIGMFIYIIGLNRAGNFRLVDIEINAWSSLFLNLETNLILHLEKYIKFNQSESCREAGKFEILRAIYG